MAAPGPSPQQMAAMQQFAAEAAKRGMSPEEFAKQQREQLTAEAAKHGMTTEQYVAQLKMRALAAHQKQMEAKRQAQESGQSSPDQPQQQQQNQTTHQVPVNPNNPADPKAIAVANWLRSQNLKTRTCVMDGQRKDLFKGMFRILSYWLVFYTFGLDFILESFYWLLANRRIYSKTCHSRPGVSRVRQSRRQEELSPPPRDGSRLGRKCLQATSPLAPRPASEQS